MWNTSWLCLSSLSRVHANLLCVMPNLVYMLLKWALDIILYQIYVQFSLVAQLCPTLQPHGMQHARPPCPSPTPRVYPDSCPSSRWCHPTISSSIIPFSSGLHSFPASGSFPMSQFFTSGGRSIGVSVSASVLPMNVQDLFPLGLTYVACIFFSIKLTFPLP